MSDNSDDEEEEEEEEVEDDDDSNDDEEENDEDGGSKDGENSKANPSEDIMIIKDIFAYIDRTSKRIRSKYLMDAKADYGKNSSAFQSEVGDKESKLPYQEKRVAQDEENNTNRTDRTSRDHPHPHNSPPNQYDPNNIPPNYKPQLPRSKPYRKMSNDNRNLDLMLNDLKNEYKRPQMSSQLNFNDMDDSSRFELLEKAVKLLASDDNN